jgi:hypothetical protein
MSETQQAGMTAYTYWTGITHDTPKEHNNRTIEDGQPDLIAQYA